MAHLARYALSAAALVALAACSDSPTTPVSRLSAPEASNAAIIPFLPDVIVGSGTFANTITPSEIGRAVGAFWDNPSSDDGNPWPNARKCNVGFFATNAAFNAQGCIFHTANDVPGGFVGGAYYGKGAGNFGSPDFTFKGGKYVFDVSLRGAFSFGSSHVGYFTIDGGGIYHLTEVLDWSSKTQAVVQIAPATDWGFWASNANFTGLRLCGTVINSACSNATGGFVNGNNAQQFSLMTNAAGTEFLVGLEDNLLGLWAGDNAANPTNQDSDYNDYIFKVTPSTPAHCTFTKGWYRNNGEDDVVAVDGRTKLEAQTIFDATPGKPKGVTWQGGNDVLNLYQQLLAAILNGGQSGPAATQAAITAALAGTGGTGLAITTTLTQAEVSDLIAKLSAFNEGTLPGFPHCA